VSLPFGARAESGGTPLWSVSALNQAIRTLVEDALPPLWVVGEVTNWTRARSGHCYFTLKDEGAQLRCVMWRTQASRLPIDPEEGMRVRILGGVTYYEARGDLQFNVRSLEDEGEDGVWKRAFERLRLRLEEEGLLDPLRKRPIPLWPSTIGVVTSPTGAALHDILTVLARRAPWTRVLLRGTRVQGEGAAEEIARAIRVLSERGEVDVLIVGRGGGSVEDLWAFNEEPVARAIANARVPVISAVGHEVDVTLSDLVADLRAPTPSAAAEAAVQDGAALRQRLSEVRPRLRFGLRAQVERRRHRLDRLEDRIQGAMGRILAPRRQGLERGREALQRAMEVRLQGSRDRIARIAGRLEDLSPLATMRRGYAVPLALSGEILRSTAAFREHPDFRLQVRDGWLECETRKVHQSPLSGPTVDRSWAGSESDGAQE
jgi:exodeoxyribonuclease VII large subunit